MNNNLFGAICLFIAASIWGGMYVVSKYVLNFIPPFTLVWLRYIIAFIVLFSVVKIVQSKYKIKNSIEKKDWLLIAWIGFIGYFISIALQFIGIKLSDAHTGSLVTSSAPAFTIIFARIFLKENFTFSKIVSLLLSTLGVVIIIGLDLKMDNYFLGSVNLVGAALAWALLSVFVKKASYRHSSLIITTYAIFFAIIFTTPLMIWELQTNQIIFNNSLVVLGILYLGIISTAVAFFLWNKGIELMDAGVGSIFLFFQPIVGSFLGWLILGEQLNSNFFIGGILILISVLIIALRKKMEKTC